MSFASICLTIIPHEIDTNEKFDHHFVQLIDNPFSAWIDANWGTRNKL